MSGRLLDSAWGCRGSRPTCGPFTCCWGVKPQNQEVMRDNSVEYGGERHFLGSFVPRFGLRKGAFGFGLQVWPKPSAVIQIKQPQQSVKVFSPKHLRVWGLGYSMVNRPHVAVTSNPRSCEQRLARRFPEDQRLPLHVPPRLCSFTSNYSRVRQFRDPNAVPYTLNP